ncbi:UNVERIFIED_CONTAM: hypothetical protein FKN15_054563 [Acipenser sinensis]
MKCLREKGQGPRIDQYFLRSQSSQSNEIQRQEANHSSQDISTPVIDVRRTCMDTVSDEPNDPCEPGQTNQHKREKNLNGHKPGVKWPRACEKTAWNTVNTDLCFALERLSGTVEKKLDKFGDIIYAYGSERFGVEKRKEKVQTIPGKSRRQQEIERLVRERRQLRKQWRRAEQSQKEGLNLLQRVIKESIQKTNQHKREKNLNGHKPGVKWPRACEKTAWNTVNTDLCFALERLSGTVEKKLDKFGDIIYAYGSERFGVEKRKEKVQTIPGKSRRQQEIERLVRERRQLRKQWRRAEQ